MHGLLMLIQIAVMRFFKPFIMVVAAITIVSGFTYGEYRIAMR